MLNEVIQRYKQQVGRKPPLSRVEKAVAFLKRHGLQPTDVKFEHHADPLWNQRQVRSDDERKAQLLGSSSYRRKNGDPVHQRIWIVPRGR